MPTEPSVPFLEALPAGWAAERFPVGFHTMGTVQPRPLSTALCSSQAYGSRMFSCVSAPKPVSRCFPR